MASNAAVFFWKITFQRKNVHREICVIRFMQVKVLSSSFNLTVKINSKHVQPISLYLRERELETEFLLVTENIVVQFAIFSLVYSEVIQKYSEDITFVSKSNGSIYY